MKKGTLVALIIVIIVVILIIWWVWWAYAQPSSPTSNNSAPMIPYTTSTPGTNPTFDQTISNGTIALRYPSADFGLATAPAQITTQSYIPPCSDSFNYCLYYTGTAYQGTNFETAGLRIDQRTDLTTQAQCLTAQPTGFTGLTPVTASSSDYAVSVFPQVGSAAAGNSATGALYRLSYDGSCYEFETRVGQSDFGNYPSGTIQQFTSAEQDAIQSELQEILGTLTLLSGETVVFPQT